MVRLVAAPQPLIDRDGVPFAGLGPIKVGKVDTAGEVVVGEPLLDFGVGESPAQDWVNDIRPLAVSSKVAVMKFRRVFGSKRRPVGVLERQSQSGVKTRG